MSALSTTDEMVHAAQDAYDRAAAEAARITRELTAALEKRGRVEELIARSMVAIAEREYAWSVLISTREDHRAEVSA